MKLFIILTLLITANVYAASEADQEYRRAQIEYLQRLDKMQSNGKKISETERQSLRNEVFAKTIELQKKEQEQRNKERIDVLEKAQSKLKEEISKLPEGGSADDDADDSPGKSSKGLSQSNSKSDAAKSKNGSKGEFAVSNPSNQGAKSSKSSNQQRVNSTTSGAVEAGGAESISFSNH